MLIIQSLTIECSLVAGWIDLWLIFFNNYFIMKCLVTGASGFLGTNLVHELVKNGWDVRTIVRPGSNTKYIESLSIEIIYGDITNQPDLDKVCAGCDVVFHVAGDTSFWKRNFKKQRFINVEVPSMIAEACIKNKVKRLVHTSTVDIFGCNPAGVADEKWTDYNFANTGYNYSDTKREGEKRVLAYNNKGLEVVVVYPGSMMGPYDFTLQYGRLFFELRDGKVPGCPAGGASFGHVTEVAKAHITAAIKGIPGEGYICAGENISYKELFDLIAAKFNKKAPGIIMKRWMLVTYGQILQFISSFTGKAPEIDPGNARYMSVNAWYDSSKAIKELDYKLVPVQQMINDAYIWYKENGFL
ncbi:MAG: NAD-dependent epimerase/dehydratase family protein [Paludibacter sp.]